MEQNEIKCAHCTFEANYLAKEGKKYIPFCKDCLSDLLIDEAENNNEVLNIDNLGDDELGNLLKK